MPRVVVRPEALAAYLRSPNGQVGRLMISLAERVKTLAKAQVGYDTKKNDGEPHLRDTIVKRILQTPTGIVVLVGSDHSIAKLHHDGTRAHVIRPKKPDGVLVFEIDGQTIFAKVVNHPGTDPNRYLTDPLKEVMAALGGL